MPVVIAKSIKVEVSADSEKWQEMRSRHEDAFAAFAESVSVYCRCVAVRAEKLIESNAEFRAYLEKYGQETDGQIEPVDNP